LSNGLVPGRRRVTPWATRKGQHRVKILMAALFRAARPFLTLLLARLRDISTAARYGINVGWGSARGARRFVRSSGLVVRCRRLSSLSSKGACNETRASVTVLGSTRHALQGDSGGYLQVLVDPSFIWVCLEGLLCKSSLVDRIMQRGYGTRSRSLADDRLSRPDCHKSAIDGDACTHFDYRCIEHYYAITNPDSPCCVRLPNPSFRHASVPEV
jgi:hypothetical protein